MEKVIDWGFMKFSADPQKCYAEVTSLPVITPENIVDLARDEDTELHKCFQWDDSIAAENWRKQQARQICQSFMITYESVEYKAKTYRLIEHDPVTKAYTPITYIARDQETYSMLLEKAKAELKSFKARYAKLAELSEIIEGIDNLLTE